MALPRETNEDISLLLEGWWNNGGQMIILSLVAPIPAGLRWKPNLSLCLVPFSIWNGSKRRENPPLRFVWSSIVSGLMDNEAEMDSCFWWEWGCWFEKAISDFSHYLAWFLISRQHTKRAQGKEEKKCYQWRKHRRCQYTQNHMQ